MGCSFLAPVQSALGKAADIVAPILVAIPGPWQIPAAVYMAVDTLNGGGSLEDVVKKVGTAYAIGQIGGQLGGAAAGAEAGTAAAFEAGGGAAIGEALPSSLMQTLVDAGVPFDALKALPSVSTLASNAAVNAAMQMATTGKVNVDSLVKSLAMGSVSSVVGAGVSSAVGSLGIDNPLLASIANSAAQGATGAALSGRNPVTAALASALAGGVGFATQSSGLSQTAINSTVNALASGQSVQNALISAAIATGSSAIKGELKDVADKAGNTIKDQIKGFFVDIGTAQGKTADEVGTAFENMCIAKSEENKFITGKQEEFTQDQATIDGNKDKIDAFQELRGTYDSKIESYERNKELATNTAAYESEMQSRGYEQFKNGDGDPLPSTGPDGWAQRTGGHWVTVSGDGGPETHYVPDTSDEDSNSIKYIPAPAQDSFIAAANADVREANAIGEQLNTAYTGGMKDVFAANKRINDNLALYKDLSTATTTALTTLNGFVPPEKIADFINTETATQAEEKTTDEATKAKIAADAEKERVRLQAETDAKNKETTEVIPEVTPEVKPEVTPEVKPEPKPSDNFIDPSKADFRVPVTDEEKKAYQDFANQTNSTKVEIISGEYIPDAPVVPAPEDDFEPYVNPETPLTPAPDQGGVPTPPPVEVPPEPCQLPFVDDGTGRCILPEDKEKEDTPIPDCGPGMVWSLTDKACVPVTDITPPVVTPVIPKPPVTPPVKPVVPVKPPVKPAVDPAQTQQNQQNALLMGLLLGQQQQAPQQQQPASLVKIDKPFDWNQDILGAADYEKATQRPYAAGGSVHAINEELLKILRS